MRHQTTKSHIFYNPKKPQNPQMQTLLFILSHKVDNSILTYFAVAEFFYDALFSYNLDLKLIIHLTLCNANRFLLFWI